MSSNYEMVMPSARPPTSCDVEVKQSDFELVMPSARPPTSCDVEVKQSDFELVMPSARPPTSCDVKAQQSDFELVMPFTSKPYSVDPMTPEDTAFMVTMYNQHVGEYKAETCLPQQNVSIFHCECGDFCVDYCNRSRVFETSFDIEAGTVTVFSESKSNNMSAKYRDFISRRDNELLLRKKDLGALAPEFMDASISLANSLDEEDFKVDEKIAREALQIKGMMVHHKNEMMRLKAIRHIPYEETVRRTSVTVRRGEQSTWITHVDDPLKRLYCFMPIRMPIVDGHAPSAPPAETVEVNQLMMDLNFM